MSSDFTGPAFIAGTLTGIRTWRPDGCGRLWAYAQRYAWTPGVNDARCLGLTALHRQLAEITVTGAQVAVAMAQPGERMSGRVSLVKAPKRAPRPHVVAGLDCKCGFYAYFTPDAPRHERLVGLIEGWGTVTAGTRGFRASKARIVALLEPVPDAVRLRYLEVPVYRDLLAAIAAHPLSVQPPAAVTA